MAHTRPDTTPGAEPRPGRGPPATGSPGGTVEAQGPGRGGEASVRQRRSRQGPTRPSATVGPVLACDVDGQGRDEWAVEGRQERSRRGRRLSPQSGAEVVPIRPRTRPPLGPGSPGTTGRDGGRPGDTFQPEGVFLDSRCQLDPQLRSLGTPADPGFSPGSPQHLVVPLPFRQSFPTQYLG